MSLSQAQKIVIGFNVATALLGFSVLFASFYARGQLNQGWGSLLGVNISSVGVAAGLLTTLLSFVGCVAAAAKQKRMLCIYIVGFVIIVVLQIGAAVTMANYSGALQIRDESQPSNKLTSPIDIAINNAVFSVFTRCCTGCPMGCTNADPSSNFPNATSDNCVYPNGTVACTQILPCTPTSPGKCFVYGSNDMIVVPPVSVNDKVCKALSVVYLNFAYVVGSVSEGSCGGGNPVAFLRAMDTLVSDSLVGVTGFFTFVAVLEAFALPAGLYLLCCTSKHKIVVGDDAEGDDEGEVEEEEEEQVEEEEEEEQPRVGSTERVKRGRNAIEQI